MAVTLCYKQAYGANLYFDAWAPSEPEDDHASAVASTQAPVVVFFHGGGLTVGNRKSWFPEWMYKRFSQLGYLFISADYRLIPPSTGHDIVEDIQDLWQFLADPTLALTFTSTTSDSSSDVTTNTDKPDGSRRFTIDLERIVVAGASAGGLCAYLCAIHCCSRESNLPRPKVVISLYGMGGDFLTPHYLSPKTVPFFIGRELLDPTDRDFQPFLYDPDVSQHETPQISDSPLSYHPQTYRIPGYPANPRMLLARLYLQLGTYLDYYTGEHEPSLSVRLRSDLMRDPTGEEHASIEGSSTEAPAMQISNFLETADDETSMIPPRHLGLFPQFMIPQMDDWPSTIFLHGTDDTAVPIAESRNLNGLLHKMQVNSTVLHAKQFKLVEIPGAEHTFDLKPDAEERWGRVFDEVAQFVDMQLDRV